MKATGTHFVAWIARHVPPDKREGQTPLQAACWFCAMQEAETLTEETVRHIAQHLLEPHPGYRTLGHVHDALDAYREDDESDLYVVARAFWGLS